MFSFQPGGMTFNNKDNLWYISDMSNRRIVTCDINGNNFNAYLSNKLDSRHGLVLFMQECSNTAAGVDVRTECNSYVWIDGNTYTSSNNTATFKIIGGAANGCDSIVTLNLTINTVSDLTTTT